MHQLAELDLSQVAKAISAGDITAESYANFVVDRAAALKSLNSFITFDTQRLIEEARAADRRRLQGASLPRLHGVPIAVKDNIDVRGYPTTAGTPALANCRPAHNAPVVQSLLGHGALVVGKLNMHEIAMGATSHNAAFGSVKNPYAIEAIPGGSSGGSAAAVAARIVPGSLGTDTIGSIRIPASLCGLVGFRPSMGRYSQARIVPLATTRDTAGPLVRSVEDAILLDSIMAAAASSEKGLLGHTRESGLKGLRLGVPRNYFYRNLDPQVAKATEQTLRVLQERGAALVMADIPELEQFDTSGSFTIIFHEVRRGIARYLEESHSGVTLEALVAQISSADVRELAGGWYRENAASEALYEHEMKVNRPALQSAVSRYFSAHGLDAIVFPTTAQPARVLKPDGMLALGHDESISQLIYLQNTDPGSYVGIPGISLPMGLTPEGLPIGLGLDAPCGNDRRLLSIAAEIEAVLPRIPPPNIVQR